MTIKDILNKVKLRNCYFNKIDKWYIDIICPYKMNYIRKLKNFIYLHYRVNTVNIVTDLNEWLFYNENEDDILYKNYIMKNYKII